MHLLLVESDSTTLQTLYALIKDAIPGARTDTASTFEDAVFRITQDLDLVIVHSALPGFSELDLAHRLRANFPDLRLLIVSSDDREERVSAAIRAGVVGFVSKHLDHSALVAVVRFVAEGGMYIPPHVLKNAVAYAHGANHQDLSERQVQVLKFVAKGFANKEIARALAITEGTVKQHMHDVCTVFGVSTRIDALRMAAQRGLHLH